MEALLNGLLQNLQLYWQQYGLIFLVMFFIVIAIPPLLAFFFNRKHFKYILIAAIPASLAFTAWVALIIWAVTGKVAERFKNKIDTE